MKPQLTDIQKLARMRWILTFIDEHSFEFEGMYTMVHMDEKRFDADVDERPATRKTPQSKQFVPKTMFLAAVARPWYDFHRKTMFDGKIGIWPLVEQYTAQRSRINRPAGTILTKNIESIDRTVIKRFLLDELIPAIKRKWPVRDRHLPILIQQDNARPH
ncbi:hypothetical protein L917_02979 [Phytophthora nicotianae]|uniref:Transposase n=1 Tax=Phytophthora nicotianae TaxID=4792 RepID=W2LS20_PHYNI|nr:hypothetical protein L917_02979 [Phytophthora nicotianae]